MTKSPTAPSRLIVGTLNEPAGRFDNYWPRLKDLDVRTPETVLIPVDSTDPLRWDAARVREAMVERDWNRAFVRGVQKAAPLRLERGSIIREPATAEIDRTLESLFTQLGQSPWNRGDAIVLREYLDLDFCLNPRHSLCRPEIRFFIEDGEILFATPERVGPESVCADGYEYLEEMLAEAEPPVEAAERVAREFTELTWGVDFALDTRGDWYCVELNLNAIRWADDIGDWINTCGHGGMESHSPRVVHAPAIAHLDRPE